MRFADPEVCPSCRRPLGGAQRCAGCGFDLTTREAGELWQTLLQADTQLQAAVARSAQPVAEPPVAEPPVPDPPAAPVPPAAPFEHPPMPRSTTPPPPPPGAAATSPAPSAPSWAVGTVLLTLGAFGLVVAAIIFVARSWDTLGVAGKAAILGAATLAVAAVAVWVTRRPLRASAEALWAVTACMVALDVVGARAEGLAGLDEVGGGWVALAGGLVLALGAGGVLVWARAHVDRDLVALGLAAIGGLVAASIGASSLGDLGAFWHAFVGLVVAGVLGLALRFTGSGLIAVGARVVLGVWYVVAAALALAELVENPAVGDVVGGGHGVPMLLVAAAAVAVAVTVPALRIVGTATAALGVVALVVVPAADLSSAATSGLGTASVIAALGAVGLAVGTSGYVKGLRWATAVVALAPGALAVWWGAQHVQLLGVAFADGVNQDDAPTDSVADALVATGPGPITTAVVAAAVLVLCLFLPRWPGLAKLSPAVALAVLGPLAASALLVAVGSSWWLVGVTFLVLGGAALVVGRAVGTGWGGAAATGLAWSAAVVGGVDAGLAIGLLLGSVVLLVLAALAVPRPWQPVPAALTPPIAALAAVAVPVELGLVVTLGLFSVPAATAVVAAVSLVRGRFSPATVTTVQVTGLVTTLVAGVVVDSALDGALVWTVMGVLTIALGTVAAPRAVTIGIGVAELVVAYVLLLVAGDIGFVEAYTLPLGVAALAAGWWLRRRRPDTHTWIAFGAGLALSTLPSLPQALAEPTSLRALLLGLGALALVAVGVRLDWQAPFVIGVVVAALVLLANIGPYAQAAPRVVIIAVVSAVLVALGVTWEDRVRDGRRLAALVKGMS